MVKAATSHDNLKNMSTIISEEGKRKVVQRGFYFGTKVRLHRGVTGYLSRCLGRYHFPDIVLGHNSVVKYRA